LAFYGSRSGPSLTLSHEIGIQARQWVVGSIGIRWVNQSKMEQVTLSVIDISDEFAALRSVYLVSFGQVQKSDS
jgi:hypothetical protein